ncbi:hypothetical protein ACFLVC_03400 [Chloroflexota bacterium]
MKNDNRERPSIPEGRLNQPGQFLDIDIEKIRGKRFRNLAILCIILAVAVTETSHVFRTLPPQPLIAGILVLVSSIYFFYADSRLQAEAERKIKGSEGEKFVGEILDRLKMPLPLIMSFYLFEAKTTSFHSQRQIRRPMLYPPSYRRLKLNLLLFIR